ncbi:MAG: magnesium chelatase subunit D family protein [Candidatus Helarchaeota archaeon]
MTHHKFVVYPFTAIVGQENMKLALILNAINPQIGGVLIRGQKGTAKSTAARALADLLPEIEVVKDCPFNCDPYNLKEMCKSCQERFEHGEKLPVQKRKMTVTNLPVSATEDRVVGTLDIERAIKHGIKALEPGILAEANHGILYIDEVNLLDDHVSDVLLDSAAMGVNLIEREGISVYHPAKFILIGTMNPEEGELRPQLLDRFGLSILIEGIKDVDDRVQVVKYREEFDDDPWKFIEKWKDNQEKLRKKIVRAREILSKVEISDELVKFISQVCINVAVHGHRADIIITKTAKTIAAFKGRTKVFEDDVFKAMELALSHRMRRKPFEEPEMKKEELEKIIKKIKNEDMNKKSKVPEINSNKKTEIPTKPKKQVFDIEKELSTQNFMDSFRRRQDKIIRFSYGKRIKSYVNNKSGRYSRFRFPNGKISDVAFDATIRNAALDFIRNGNNFKISTDNIREKVREGKISALVVIAVDASGSMGAENRMKFAKGLVFNILNDVYQKRDKIALISFRKKDAKILLPPTSSIDLAINYLRELPTGGKTPLSAGILKAIQLIEVQKRKKSQILPLLILITDGKGNVTFKNNIEEDFKLLKNLIEKHHIHSIVIDTENQTLPLGLAKQLAETFKCSYYHMTDLNLSKNFNNLINFSYPNNVS